MMEWMRWNKKLTGTFFGIMMFFLASITVFANADETVAASQNETTQTTTEENAAADTTLSEKNEIGQNEDVFSTPGNGEVQDDIQDGSSKEFMTITTKNNNTFYLVIDRSSATQNVYLLSQVDENDLKDFLDSETETATSTPLPSVVLDENESEKPEEKEEPVETEKVAAPKTNVGAMAVILILAVSGVAVYYYFKIYKPKKDMEDDFKEEGLETDDGLETINEDEEEHE